MIHSVQIENIEQMRREAGIDDVELRAEILELKIGDHVRITFISESNSHETLLVRISRIQGTWFRGELAQRPELSALSKLEPGMEIAFSDAHIHSLRNLPCKPTKTASAASAPDNQFATD